MIPNATFAQMEGKFSFTCIYIEGPGMGAESVTTNQSEHVRIMLTDNLGIMNLKVFVIRFGNHE